MGRRERGAVSALGSAAVIPATGSAPCPNGPGRTQPLRLFLSSPVTILCSRVCDSSDIVAVVRGVTATLPRSVLTRACLFSSRFGPINPLLPFSTLVFTRFHTTPLVVTRAPRTATTGHPPSPPRPVNPAWSVGCVVTGWSTFARSSDRVQFPTSGPD